MNISALNEAGKPVDWWFLYKVPKLNKKAGTDATPSAVGYEYVYFDGVQNKVTFSPNKLNDGKGALDLTLSALFANKDASTGWILYNDEMPAGTGEKDDGLLGHTKGVIAFDVASKTAIWLLHSWPKYAEPGAKTMPTPIYGQTFLCLSIDLATASAIAQQMAVYQQPRIYLPHLPAALAKSDPLYALTQPLNKTVAGGTSSIACKTRGGLAFNVIAKNREWGKDFWNELVGPALKQDMDVETWIRGKIPSTLDSDGVHKTFDIKFIDLRPLGAPWAWPETQDHAKWGITLADNWVCVGDINRMISQEKRGGGTIALQNEVLWNALKQTDLMIPPPGMSMATAKMLVKATQVEG
jgi:deoxyribonuclease-2